MAPTITNTSPPTVTSLATNTALALPSPLAPATATQGVIVFWSPTPTGTFYTSTPLASSLAVGCSNMALIRDVTIPAGTEFRPGETFTKTWQVANTGTCNWLFGYSLVHGSGNRMNGSGYRLSERINVPVPPNEWRQISVELDAPQEPGAYSATWRIANGEGQPFGASLGVSIVVRRNPSPTATPNLAQTANAAVQQTAAAAAQQTAVAGQIQTAIAATQTAQAGAPLTATAVCGTALAQGTPPPCP
jgi:hypothetical protein